MKIKIAVLSLFSSLIVPSISYAQCANPWAPATACWCSSANGNVAVFAHCGPCTGAVSGCQTVGLMLEGGGVHPLSITEADVNRMLDDVRANSEPYATDEATAESRARGMN